MRAMIRYEVNYSDALNLAGRYQQAVDLALAGIEAAGTLGLQRSLGAMLAGNAAEPLLALGEWDRAGRMVQRALELDPPEQHHIHLRLLLAWMHVWRGELEEAEAVLSEFRALIAEAAATPMYSGVALQVDADYAAAAGDYARAWADTEKFLQHRRVFAASMIYPLLAAGAAAARALDNQDRDHSSAAGSRTGVPGRAGPRRPCRGAADRHPSEMAAGDRGEPRRHGRRLAYGVEGAGRRAGTGAPAAVRGPAAGAAPGRLAGSGRGPGGARRGRANWRRSSELDC